MSTEGEKESTPPVAEPPAGPPTPPTDNTPDYVAELRGTVSDLTNRVEELSARVESMAPVGGEQDTQPVSRPWTSRGRR